MFKILYKDDHYVAIHKPPNWLVHRTALSQDRKFVLQELRNQLGQHVFPLHRLDRPTAGVIMFGLDSASAAAMAEQFQAREIKKTYLAIVRGWSKDSDRIEIELKKDGEGDLQEAVTEYETTARIELPIPVGPYEKSRYSFLSVMPETGRMHQIRRHLKHASHPIIGDKKHGDRAHNRMFEDKYDLTGLQLLAWKIAFKHPFSGENMLIETAPEASMLKMMDLFDWVLPEAESK